MRSKKKSKINKKLTRRQKGGNKKLLTVQLGEGLGNRIFKILAGLRFAEKWDMDFCLVKSQILDNDHASLEESINDIKVLFPNLPIVDISNNFPIEYHEKERYVYEEFSKPNDNTILHGTFQSEKYFQDNINISIPSPKDNILKDVNAENLYFIQFRLDDYLNYSETNLNLVNYYKYCINDLKKTNNSISFVIISKNIDDAKKYINDNLNDVLDINTLIFDPNTSRLDSLYYMSKCKGAIIPNSTFAWFGAYLSCKEKVYFPSPWMSSLIKDKQYDIYPDWSTVVDVDIKVGGEKSMKAYVINLDNRPEKWERIKKDFKDTDIDVERFSGIKHANGHIGCGLTHVALVKMAKEKNMDSILIIEDDCKLTKNFNKRWAIIKKYLDEHKDEWDIFNGGVVWPANLTTIVRLEPDINLIRSNGPGCRYAHFVCVNKSGYDKAIEWENMVLEAIKDNKEFIDPKYDSWINEYPRFRNLLLKEAALAVQYNGHSNTNDVDKNISRWAAEQEGMIQDGGNDCKIHYFTVSTMYTRDMKRLERNAEKYGWKISILGLEQNRKDLGWEDENKDNGVKGKNYGDFSLKLNGLNDFIRDKKDDDIILWTDAWDVVVLDTCEIMYEKYVKFNKAIVFSAEKYCSPDASKRDLYDTLDTKFPFLCAGMFIGRVDKLKYLMTFYKGEKMNDQVFWTDMYLKNKDLIALDNNAEIFLSTWDTDGKYYQFADNRFTYTDTSTSPIFVHANGNIKDKLRLFEDYFNLGIENAYVINLEERTSKWSQIQDDFKNTNFFLERFNAIRDEVGHKGCGKSFQAIVQMAKEKNMDSVLILEDDCKPLDNFNERWILVKKWLNHNNEKWEVFNGGLKTVHGSETQLIARIDEKNRIHSINKGGINAHMVLFKKESYDRILEWDYDKNWIIDYNYINTNKFKTVYVEPALTVQRDGFSNTEKINKQNQLGGKKRRTRKRLTIKKRKRNGGGESIEYITVSTKDKPELQKLLTTGKRFGWDIKVLGLEEDRNNLGWQAHGNNNKVPNGKSGNFSIKLSYPKQFVENIDPNTIVVISDAWDAYVLGTPEEMIKRYKKFNKDIVISGENNCSPNSSKKHIFEDLKNDPFPYLCSGVIIGKAGTIKEMLAPYNNEKMQDQPYWRDIYEKNKDKIAIDSKAEIFLSMHATKAEDYDFTNDIFTYKPTNTRPLVVHGNGDGKDRLHLFERYYTSQNGGGETIHYITVSTKDTPELQRLIKSAKKYGWNLEVLGLDLDTTNLGHSKGGKFGMKLRYPKEYLKDKNDNDIVLFSDAWDVMVVGRPEELISKYKVFNKDIVISAENVCWPDGSRESEYIDTKNEPFPYLNSGGYVGKVGTLKKIYDNYNDDDIDDQRFWTDMYFKNRDKIVLDTKAEIFLSMHDVKQEDFQFDNEKFTYKETGTHPILVHGNGTSKILLDIFTEKIQIGGKRKNKTKKKKKMKGGALHDVKLERNLSKEELSDKMKKYSVIFGGTARNVGPHIKNVLDNIDRCGNRFNKYQVIIYENDSSDDTRKILNDNKKDNYHYIFEDNIAEPRRTFRLANGRQKVLDKAKELNKNNEYDFYIVVDLDERMETGSYVDTIETCFINDDWDILCGNQVDEYYDIWTIRRKGDIDYDFLNEPDKHKNFSGRLKYDPGMLLEVDAAFGGIAIYRMKSLDDECKYSGDWGDGREQCEHVPFTKCLKSKGRKIYINTSFLTNVPKASGGNVMINNKGGDQANFKKYTAIIVDSRKHMALEFVFNNILENLDNQWDIIVCHGNLNKEYINDIINNKLQIYKNRISLVNLNINNLSSYEYNKLLTSKEFYNNIPTETFLVFQTDSIINPKNKNKINNFLQYDYVGAPWLNPVNGVSVGNGGFSLRKKSKMLEIINNCAYTDNLNEDVYFSTSCPTVKMNIPNIEIAKEFSSEYIWNPESFGIHQIWTHNDIDIVSNTFPEVKQLYELQGINT